MEWKEVRLGEVCSNSCSGGTPKSTVEDYYGGEIPWLNTKEIDFNRIYKTEKYITDLGLRNSSAKWIKENCVIIAMYGATAAKVAINKIPLTTNQACCNLEINSKLADYNYVYYAIKNDFTKLASLANGGAQQNLNSQLIKDYEIHLPPLDTQRKISSVLSSLDDKIETNNKLNSKLEEMAQAIFKEWFVDFGPFKNGKMVESEMGLIPEGWKVGKLGEICTFKRGKVIVAKNAIPGDIPVVAGGMEPAYYHNEANTKAPVVTISNSGANAGFMRMYHSDIWASDCSFIDKECHNIYFVYCFLSINSRLLRHAQTGAVQPHVKPSDVNNFDMILPPQNIIEEFQTIIKPIITQIGFNIKESQRLSTLRDSLLPKLMKGEIEI
ncbi:MAG: restriction endonuclease subunit S [Bacteroidales bacterium]|nr:restriction endonuclease subunit S [Bacteroidales bacterium]